MATGDNTKMPKLDLGNFSYKMCLAILAAFLFSAYSPKLASELPSTIRVFFENSVARFIIIVLIIYLGNSNLELSVLIAASIALIMMFVHKYEIKESLSNKIHEDFFNGYGSIEGFETNDIFSALKTLFDAGAKSDGDNSGTQEPEHEYNQEPTTPPSGEYNQEPTTPPNGEYNPTTPPNGEYNQEPTTPPNGEYNPTTPPSGEYNPTTPPSGEYNPTTPPPENEYNPSITPTPFPTNYHDEPGTQGNRPSHASETGPPDHSSGNSNWSVGNNPNTGPPAHASETGPPAHASETGPPDHSSGNSNWSVGNNPNTGPPYKNESFVNYRPTNLISRLNHLSQIQNKINSSIQRYKGDI